LDAAWEANGISVHDTSGNVVKGLDALNAIAHGLRYDKYGNRNASNTGELRDAGYIVQEVFKDVPTIHVSGNHTKYDSFVMTPEYGRHYDPNIDGWVDVTKLTRSLSTANNNYAGDVDSYNSELNRLEGDLEPQWDAYNKKKKEYDERYGVTKGSDGVISSGMGTIRATPVAPTTQLSDIPAQPQDPSTVMTRAIDAIFPKDASGNRTYKDEYGRSVTTSSDSKLLDKFFSIKAMNVDGSGTKYWMTRGYKDSIWNKLANSITSTLGYSKGSEHLSKYNQYTFNYYKNGNDIPRLKADLDAWNKNWETRKPELEEQWSQYDKDIAEYNEYIANL
jgi:hypothetical protein